MHNELMKARLQKTQSGLSLLLNTQLIKLLKFGQANQIQIIFSLHALAIKFNKNYDYEHLLVMSSIGSVLSSISQLVIA
jgi:hypothetical protein